MIHASLRMKFAPNKLAEVREILGAIVEWTRLSPGCVDSGIYQDMLDAGVILLEEWWSAQADLVRHLQSSQYRRVILVMEMALECPVVRFSEIGKTTGMETIRNSRFGVSQGG